MTPNESNLREVMMEAFSKATTAHINSEHATTDGEAYAWNQASKMLFDIGNKIREELGINIHY